MVSRYVPDSGDLIWLDFDPVEGHEQGGHHPAVVLSPFAYNNPVGLLLCVPCTTIIKGCPFEVEVSDESVALADQVTCIDWHGRKVTKKRESFSESTCRDKRKSSNAHRKLNWELK